MKIRRTPIPEGDRAVIRAGREVVRIEPDDRLLVVIPPIGQYPDGTVLSFTPADIDAALEMSVRHQFGIHGPNWSVAVTRAPDGSRCAAITRKG